MKYVTYSSLVFSGFKSVSIGGEMQDRIHIRLCYRATSGCSDNNFKYIYHRYIRCQREAAI